MSVGLPLALSAPAAADGLAQFTFEPSTVEVRAGETFTIDLDLQSTPQFASGATQVGVVVLFDETYVDATDVERGPFMNLHEETTIETNVSEINNSAGYLIYDLKREPAKGGTYGLATFATFTFEVPENAPDGTFQIEVWRARILLSDGMQQQVRKATATVNVTGAGSATPDGTRTPSPDRTATANGSAAGTTPAGGGSNPGSGSDERAGFGRVMTFVALGGAVGLFGGMVVLMRKFVPADRRETPGETVTDERSGDAGPPGSCPACGDTFRNEQAVRDHAWDAHGACHHCGSSFASRESLNAHWLAAHEDQLSPIDRRKAGQAADSLTTGEKLAAFGPRGVISDNRPLALLGLAGLVVVAVAFVAGYAVAGGSPIDSVAGGSTNEVSVGTPSGETGPQGHDATRQSTTQLGEPGSVHWHAPFEVIIDGHRVDFAKPSYMVRSKYVHVENGDGTRIHKHATGVTLTDFFYTIDWLLTDECLVTPDGSSYCSGDGATLEIVVNGGEIDEPAAYEIRDGDEIRIVYERMGENA